MTETRQDAANRKLNTLDADLPLWQLVYNAGWDGVGEWCCANCGYIVGKNLRGDMPFVIARDHAKKCCESLDNGK